jgi:DNA-binding MarR family transcriptional regulator
VFAEAIPAAIRLSDPKTPDDERERLVSDAIDSIEVVRNIADRNAQREPNSVRHKENHERRDTVMTRYKYVPGKRREPKRLAKASGVSRRTVEKWIKQLRQGDLKGREAIPDDWRTVYVGNRLRQQARLAAHASVEARRQRQKLKG